MKMNLTHSELSLAEQICNLPDDEQIAWLESLYGELSAVGDDEMASFSKNWDIWGRPEQQLPDHDNWDVLFWMAGRGAGKTRPGAEAVNKMAEQHNWRIALVGETSAEVRDVMVEGPSGILATCHPSNPAEYYPSKRRVVWPKTGTWATTYSGDAPDQLRGPNVNFAWVDEIAKFKYPDETWDQLELVLRAGEHPQCVVSSTPRPIKLVKMLLNEPRTVVRRWATYRNAANLAPTYLDRILNRYEGTRLGRQEIHAEVLEDVEGALWTQQLLEDTRVRKYPDLVRIVIGVDPAGSTVTETGIMVAGLGKDGHGYVLDDMSLAATPGGWGAEAVTGYDKYKADRICAESNNGGDMVISTIETAAKDAGIRVATKKLHASRGKYARAEPVAALYEQGRVHHVGMFAQCEDELTNWIPNEGLPSPNRLDALVWALTELMLTGKDTPIVAPAGALQTSKWKG